MTELVFFFASFGIVPALATAFALRWAVRILRAHRWSAAVFAARGWAVLMRSAMASTSGFSVRASSITNVP